jgi:hypothetical protein
VRPAPAPFDFPSVFENSRIPATSMQISETKIESGTTKFFRRSLSGRASQTFPNMKGVRQEQPNNEFLTGLIQFPHVCISVLPRNKSALEVDRLAQTPGMWPLHPVANIRLFD